MRESPFFKLTPRYNPPPSLFSDVWTLSSFFPFLSRDSLRTVLRRLLGPEFFFLPPLKNCLMPKRHRHFSFPCISSFPLLDLSPNSRGPWKLFPLNFSSNAPCVCTLGFFTHYYDGFATLLFFLTFSCSLNYPSFPPKVSWPSPPGSPPCCVPPLLQFLSSVPSRKISTLVGDHVFFELHLVPKEASVPSLLSPPLPLGGRLLHSLNTPGSLWNASFLLLLGFFTFLYSRSYGKRCLLRTWAYICYQCIDSPLCCPSSLPP